MLGSATRENAIDMLAKMMVHVFNMGLLLRKFQHFFFFNSMILTNLNFCAIIEKKNPVESTLRRI